MTRARNLLGHLLLAWLFVGGWSSPLRNETIEGKTSWVESRAPRGFVTVANPETFAINGKRFIPVGCNNYYMLTRGASQSVRYQAIEVYDGMEELGLNTLRMWAFNDGSNQWNALQTSPGVYSENVFRGLDWNVAEAGRRGMKLILVLVNYWPEYGGMQQYVDWSPTASRLEDFYTDANCRRYYRQFVSAVVNRVNTITGIPYKDDPAIMAWELANEARNPADPSGAEMVAWVDEMSSYIKSMDPNHLVATGSEGFFGRGPYASLNPTSYFQTVGVSSELQHALVNVDFITAHMWADQWLPQGSNLDQFARQWINSQLKLASDLEKPFVLEEFGRSPDGNVRLNFFDAVYSTFIAALEAGKPAGGILFWYLASRDYPDYDGYTIYPVLPGRSDSLSTPVTPMDESCVGCCDGKNNCTACNNGRGISADARFIEEFDEVQSRSGAPLLIQPVTARNCALGVATSSVDCAAIPDNLLREASDVCIGMRVAPTDPEVIALIENAVYEISEFDGEPVDPGPMPPVLPPPTPSPPPILPPPTPPPPTPSPPPILPPPTPPPPTPSPPPILPPPTLPPPTPSPPPILPPPTPSPTPSPSKFPVTILPLPDSGDCSPSQGVISLSFEIADGGNASLQMYSPGDTIVLDISKPSFGLSHYDYCAPCDTSFKVLASGSKDILEVRLDGRLVSTLELSGEPQEIWFTTCSVGNGGTSVPACTTSSKTVDDSRSRESVTTAWQLPLLAEYEDEAIAYAVEEQSSKDAVVSPRSDMYFPIVWATLSEGQEFRILTSSGRGNFEIGLVGCSGVVQTGLSGDKFSVSRRIANPYRGDITILVEQSVGDRCSEAVYQLLLVGLDGMCSVLPVIEAADYTSF